MRRNKLKFLTLLLLGWVSPIFAKCTGAGCTCGVSATSVAFGVYNTASATPNDNTGTISVTCSGNATSNHTVSYTIALSAGNAPSTYANRVMLNGLNQLQYNLYTDSARTIIWGDGTAGTGIWSEPEFTTTGSTPVTHAHTVFGRIPASQGVPPGSYLDQITATVTF